MAIDPMMQKPIDESDTELRQLLDDVAAGRISPSDAERQIKNLAPKPTPAEAAVALLRERISRQQRKRFPWPAAMLMAAFGAGFFGIGVYTGRKTLDFVVNGTPTEGLVVRMEHNKKHAKPVVKYSVNGRDFEIKGDIGTSPPAFFVGERVEVLHKIGKPEEAVINSFSERWLFPIVFGGIGMLVGLAGCGILLVKLSSKLLGGARSSRNDERFTVEQ